MGGRGKGRGGGCLEKKVERGGEGGGWAAHTSPLHSAGHILHWLEADSPHPVLVPDQSELLLDNAKPPLSDPPKLLPFIKLSPHLEIPPGGCEHQVDVPVHSEGKCQPTYAAIL